MILTEIKLDGNIWLKSFLIFALPLSYLLFSISLEFQTGIEPATDYFDESITITTSVKVFWVEQ